MRRVRELRWLLAAQAFVAFVALVVVVPRVVDCLSLEVSTSIEPGKIAALGAIADDFNHQDHRVGNRCIEVHVHGTSSGRAMQALRAGWSGSDEAGKPAPQVWLPTSSMWVELLRHSGRVANLAETGDLESIAQSTLVVAMPEPMVGALRLEDQQISWDQLRVWARTNWADHGYPEWGDLTFGKDDPTQSTSGLAATVATFHVAAKEVLGRTGALRPDDLSNDDVESFVLGVEAGVHYYPPDIVDFLHAMAENDFGDPEFEHPYVSAVVMQEQLVYEYNRGGYNDEHGHERPNEKLVALYPTDGTLPLDHPYVVLPSIDDDQEAAAEQFFDHLLGPAAQRHLTDAGFRDHEGHLALDRAARDHGLRSGVDDRANVPLPSGEVLQKINDTWSLYRKKARILLVVDRSKSMGTDFERKDNSRFEVMQQTLTDGLEHLPEDDEIGLWTFPADDGDPEAHEPLVDIGAFGAAQKASILDEVAGLGTTPGRSTPLYRAIQEAYDELSRTAADGRIKAVVVLTDGTDNDPDGGLSRDELVRHLQAGSAGPDDSSPVTVFCVALPGADFDDMGAIAGATGGLVYPAEDPTSLADALVSIFNSL